MKMNAFMIPRAMRRMAIVLVATLSLSSALAGEAPNGVVRFDFETGDLQGWTVVDGGFGKLLTDRDAFHHGGKPYNKQGKFFLSTLETAADPNDQFTGVVESPVFTLAAPEISLLVGGGSHGDTYVALCSLDGRELLKAHGTNAQPMQRIQWNAAQSVGRKVFLRMVDRNTGDWGHITFDDCSCRGTIDAEATRERFRDLAAVVPPTAPVRAAVQDLVATFGARYPGGADFLARLDALDKALVSENAEEAAKALTELPALRREALIANPLVGGAP